MAQPNRLTAADIMTTKVVSLGSHEDLTRVAGEMKRHQIGSVVIMENKKLVGILTEKDLAGVVERVGTFLERSQAKDHMTSPVLTVQSDTSLTEVTKLMAEKHVRHIIVLNNKREVAGIISSRDIVKVTKEGVTI